ncbi:MAG: acyl-CoA carboxylase subunit beta [Coprothermobacterota bacterium]|nr:acyl-CoA carboxylase subunit beta [Coprothermobacterota bacterium]
MAQLAEQKKIITEGMGKKAAEARHKKGQLTARERIELLLDPGSFQELDRFVKTRSTYFGLDKKEIPAEGVITGLGLINGRRVALSAQDFSVLGGSIGEMHGLKITNMQDLAMKMGIPFLCLNDSGGARIQEGIDSLMSIAEVMKRNSLASGVIPQIAMVLGPVAAGAAYSPSLMDFVVMTEIATMYVTGPDVLEAVTGQKTTHEQLGGGLVHNQLSGVAHFLTKDDSEAIALVKKLLSFLPDNFLHEPPLASNRDPINRVDESLKDLIPMNSSKTYDVKEVIQRFVDFGDFLEVHAYFAPNAVVGFARLGGRAVGIVANQSQHRAGTMDINAADKIARFVRCCDCFNIPLITLVDTPGFFPGIDQEHNGILRHGAKVLFAYSEATVPKITLILRKAYGGAYIAMCSKHLGGDLSFAYPTAAIAVMGAEGAANICFRKEIAEAADPVQARKEKIEQYRAQFSNPYRAAERSYVDDIIDPKDTRPVLAGALEFLRSKSVEAPDKKHSNMPL